MPGVTGKFGLGVQNEQGKGQQSFANRMYWSCQTPLSNNTTGNYTWTSPDGQHQNHIDFILCNRRWRSSTQSAEMRLEADCGSFQIMNSLCKIQT